MNTKNDCWLCGYGYGVDNGGMAPGEMHHDSEGDLICVYCENRINFTARIMDNPNLLQLIGAIQALPKVDGVRIGINFEETEAVGRPMIGWI